MLSSSRKLLSPRGFTLLEVVLAIGLTGTLLALLTTAIDLYLVRVDANRSKVEAAQLARTLLGQIADDISNARYYAPGDSSSRGSSQGTESAGKVMGIFGTATELRIDRSARWNWARTSRQVDPTQGTPGDEMPTTVGYIYNDGETMLADRLAALGVVAESSLPGYAGLYRRQTPTPAWLFQNNSTGVNLITNSLTEPKLLAPEVLAMEFAYFDGQQLLDAWDSGKQQGLPLGIEIRLTLLMEPYDLALAESQQERETQLRDSRNQAKYTLFVRLPERQPPAQPSTDRSSSGTGSSDSGGSGTGNQDSSGGSTSGS